jgi:VanZ family protein
MDAFGKVMVRASRVPRWVRWGAAVVWMAVIYLFSAQPSSGQHSHAFVAWLLGLAGLQADPAGLGVLQLGVRKLAHLTEYAVLAALLGWALRPGATRWPVAWGLALAWAGTDEWHQTFVPNRVGTPVDVAIDGLGAALAAVVGWRFERARRPW